MEKLVKNDSFRMATAYGYDPRTDYDGPELGDSYALSWTERQAAKDVAERYKAQYGRWPIAIRVETHTYYEMI